MYNIIYTKTYGKKAYVALNIALMSDHCSLAAFSENAVGHRAGEVKLVIRRQRPTAYSIVTSVMMPDNEVVLACDPGFTMEKTTLRVMRSKLKTVISAAEKIFGQDEKLYFFPHSLHTFGVCMADMPVKDGVIKSLVDDCSPDFIEELLKKHRTFMMMYGRWPYANAALSREDGITIREMKKVAEQLLHPTYEEKLDDEMQCLRREMLVKSLLDGYTSFFRTWEIYHGRNPDSSFTLEQVVDVVSAEDPMKMFKYITEQLIHEQSGVSDRNRHMNGDPAVQLKAKLVDPELPRFIETIKMLRDPAVGMLSIEVITTGYIPYRNTYFRES